MPPDKGMLVAPAAGCAEVNPQLSVTEGVAATCMPEGKDSVSAADVSPLELVLAKVMLSRLVSPALMVAGVNCGVTVTVAEAISGTKPANRPNTFKTQR